MEERTLAKNNPGSAVVVLASLKMLIQVGVTKEELLQNDVASNLFLQIYPKYGISIE